MTNLGLFENLGRMKTGGSGQREKLPGEEIV